MSLLSVDDARAKVLEAVAPLGTIDLKIGDAPGFVVADDVTAPHALPRFDNSAMDGYAVLAADVAEASSRTPVILDLVGEVRAGFPGDVRLTPGTAARIMTGAEIPEGADAVVPVEETTEEGDKVRIEGAAFPGRHVRPAGDDFEAGRLLVPRGTELGPGEVALLSSIGASPITVHRRPRVAILVTGDELLDPEEEPGPGQIRDSNSIALRALAEESGAEVVVQERVPDDRGATLAAFSRAAEEADLVVSSGGVAVGRYDFVKEVIEELGRIDMWRVAMQPGKPVVLGSIGDTPFLGLPGNPVSIHVSFEQFVRPALRKMRGAKELLRPTLRGTLTDTVTKKRGRLHFVRVRLRATENGWSATPTGPQGSHIQSSLVGCHGVARFGIEDTELRAGEEVVVEVWRLPDA